MRTLIYFTKEQLTFIKKQRNNKNYNFKIKLFETESEKYHEMLAATESPPKATGAFRLDDDADFPPVTQRTD